MFVILHVAPIDGEKVTGLNKSIPETLNSLLEIEIKIALLSSSKKGYRKEEKFQIFNRVDGNSKITNLDDLPKPFDTPSLIVFHSTYIPYHIKLAKEAVKKGIPYIITPRSGMTIEGQKQKGIKKRIANFLFFNNYIRNSAAIHCLTYNEANDVNIKWRHETFILGNGMDVPHTSNHVISPNLLNMVFIGRMDIHHKGLDLLLQAVNLARKELLENKVEINIYGTDVNGSKNSLLQYIDRLNINNIVKIHNPIFEQEKIKVLSSADLFIHTSRFEGHPMSVLEALAYSIPCILTPGTNMADEVQNVNAGWKTDSNPRDIADTIISATRYILDQPEQYSNMRMNARSLIEENYTWDRIAKKLLVEYEKLINK